MGKNADAVEDPLNSEFPKNVVGAIKHHIRMLEVSMTNIWYYPAEPINIRYGARAWHCRSGRSTGIGDAGLSMANLVKD